MSGLKRAGSVSRRPQVVFNGTKVFWRTKNSIDVWILNHKSCRALEIIAYEPSLRVESARIYLDASVLKKKLDRSGMEHKLKMAKESGQPVDELAIVDNVVCEAIANYVMPRLVADEFVSGNKFAARWQFQMGDFDGANTAPLLISRPKELTPYQTRHNKKSLAGVVHDVVASFTDPSTIRLSKRERWRIPLVIVKVMRWNRLQESDMRIFQRIQANLKTEQDIIRMESVMRAVPTSSCGASQAKPDETVGSSQPSEARQKPMGGLARRSFSYGVEVRKKRNSHSSTRSSAIRLRGSLMMADSADNTIEDNDANMGNSSQRDDGVNSAAFKLVVSTFSALGSSIKSSFSGKRRNSTIVPISESGEFHEPAAQPQVENEGLPADRQSSGSHLLANDPSCAKISHNLNLGNNKNATSGNSAKNPNNGIVAMLLPSASALLSWANSSTWNRSQAVLVTGRPEGREKPGLTPTASMSINSSRLGWNRGQRQESVTDRDPGAGDDEEAFGAAAEGGTEADTGGALRTKPAAMHVTKGVWLSGYLINMLGWSRANSAML